MAAITFPSSPSINQIFSSDGHSWQWDGTAWRVFNLTSEPSINYSTITLGNSAAENFQPIATEATNGVNTVTFLTGTNVTWTPPSGISWLKIEIWGGGGGGAGQYFSGCIATAGGGGGGGAYNFLTIPINDIQGTIVYTVGAGGLGGAPGTTSAGTNGGTTSVTLNKVAIVSGIFNDETIYAYGGNGASNNTHGIGGGVLSAPVSTTPGQPINTAFGGTSTATTYTIYGGLVGVGVTTSVAKTLYGGGGGGAGDLSPASFTTSTFGGNGGAGATSTTVAQAGKFPAGGGGGGSAANTTIAGKTGGNGGNGCVKFTYW